MTEAQLLLLLGDRALTPQQRQFVKWFADADKRQAFFNQMGQAAREMMRRAGIVTRHDMREHLIVMRACGAID